MDREVVHQDLETARATFHHLVATATEADLRRRSDGTRWTNKQLLFHMLLGHLILRALTRLVRVFGRLPVHDTSHGGHVRPRHRQAAPADRHRNGRGSRPRDALPTRWDPFFTDYMTLADGYRFPTRHSHFHRHQLSFGDHLGPLP